MTRQKSFKTRVRARMDKTGESYTAARRRLLAKAEGETGETEAAGLPARERSGGGVPDARAGQRRMSDEVVRARTGRDFDEWFALLDDWGAADRTHSQIARWLSEEQGTGGWWAQSVTVAYEQARGRRAPGQHPEGFAITASKTIAVPVERLFEAFADEGLRGRWLPDAPLEVRTARPPRSLRANWGDGSTRVNVGFVAKGEGKSQVGLAHERLADAEVAESMKAYWRGRMTELKRMLES